jgi:aldose 1-epimerase
VRDSSGRATMTVRGKQQQLDVLVGPNYRAMVIYAPKAAPVTGGGFICFEPMAGISDALNLAHKGLYKELQSILPGRSWQESFWVRPSGF